eukprot:TRINITY_DN46818_c0_g1_i1.p1 TRINITY_DN46818_c0_g1~~TRINITY_DN46818_c0_g1_i1.p1  ORF type:complete len:303 (-),score=43.17 TRINITY_DN46818_c0_g1_i1:122-1030(-)
MASPQRESSGDVTTGDALRKLPGIGRLLGQRDRLRQRLTGSADVPIHLHALGSLGRRFGSGSASSTAAADRVRSTSIREESPSKGETHHAGAMTLEEFIGGARAVDSSRSANDSTAYDRTTKVDGVTSRGAYLLFSAAQHGVLSIVWSDRAVEGALAFGRPSKFVPEFKFARGGRTDLKRNVQENKLHFYEGWCLFVKVCRQFDCSLRVLGSSSPISTALWLHYASGNRVQKVLPGEEVKLLGVDAVIAAHADSSDLNVSTLERALFVMKGQLCGYCVSLPMRSPSEAYCVPACINLCGSNA